MKKIALISAILFFVVFFWANLFMDDGDTLTDGYPAAAANSADEGKADDEIALNPTMEAKALADEEGGYYLIVASFSDLDQAVQVAEKYENEFDAEMIVLPPTPQGYYRVSYGRYSTPLEAGATLPVVRERISSDAWIYNMN